MNEVSSKRRLPRRLRAFTILALTFLVLAGVTGVVFAGKSTIGVAAMGYAKPGCRICGGSVRFDGLELTSASDEPHWPAPVSVVSRLIPKTLL